MPFTSHNERIKAVYGNYCFWSWLKYWHLDNPYEISMVLLDKSYYDYDYELAKQKAERHEQSEERTQRMMDRFGFGKVKSMNDLLQSDKASALQEIIMKEEQSKK